MQPSRNQSSLRAKLRRVVGVTLLAVSAVTTADARDIVSFFTNNCAVCRSMNLLDGSVKGLATTNNPQAGQN